MLTVEQIRTIAADYFKDKPVKQVWLFGSYASGEAHEESNADFLVNMDDTRKGLTYFGLARILGDLEVIFKRRLDLVEEQGIFPKLRPYILNDRKLIYSI